MSETSDDLDGQGGALPLDEMQRLAMLERELGLLLRLAQTRDEAPMQAWALQARLSALTSGLRALARELGPASDWDQPAVPEIASASAAEDDGGAETADPALDRSAREAPFAFGVTMDQFDALDRLIQLIKAHGDVVSMHEMSGLARGTLAMMGQAIFEGATEVREILDQVEDQAVVPTSARVREAWAVYDAAPPGATAHASRAAAVPCRVGLH